MLNLNQYHQDCRHRCTSGCRFSLSKSNVNYFLGGEKQQLEIRLCLQAVLNPNHDINKSVGLTQTGQTLRRAKPPVFLFPVLLLYSVSLFSPCNYGPTPHRGGQGGLWYCGIGLFSRIILVSSRPAVCGFSSFWPVMVISKRRSFTVSQ